MLQKLDDEAQINFQKHLVNTVRESEHLFSGNYEVL